jgi:hypothetical protein
VVIELGDHDPVARPPASSQTARQMERECRHVGAEGNFPGSRAQEVGHGRASAGNERVGFLARGVGPMSIRVVVVEVVRHGIYDRPGNLGASRPVEIGHRMTTVPSLESRKSGAKQGKLGCARPR